MPRAIKLGISLASLCLAMATAPAAARGGTDEPLARLEGAICPGVMGISTEPALQILDRIRANSERLGIRVADAESCRLNVLVAFVDDPSESILSLMERQPQLFQTLSATHKRELIESDAPVRAWNVVVTRTRDGMRVPQRENLVQVPEAVMWSAHSRVYVPIQRSILSSVVLFDGQELGEITTTQLADYATFRALTADHSAMPETDSSILQLFDEHAEPSAISETDLAFLKTLYSGMPNLPARLKSRHIARSLEATEDIE